MNSILFPVALLVVAAVVLFVALLMRPGGSRSVRATLVVAAAYAVLATVGAVITLVNLLVADQVEMTLTIEGAPVPFAESTVSGSSTIAGDFTGGTVNALVENLPSDARALWAVGQFLTVLVPAAIAALIALACFQILRGATFARSMSRAALITGVTVLIGGTLAQVLSQWGAGIVSREALPFDGTFPSGMFTVVIPFWPIGAALAFGALSTVLSAGYSLQKDTAGLV